MNSKCKFLIVLFLIFTVATMQVQAERYKGYIVKKSPKDGSGCMAPASKTELALNSVRALLRTNGTMWFSESTAAYEIPKGSKKTSLFSASLWIGGYSLPNGNGTLHLAAMRFAQVGNDYWTGPLNMKTAQIDQPSCTAYDNFYPMLRVDVERHRASFEEKDYVMPASIKNWPGNGRVEKGESRFLAPYVDVGGDPNKYEPDQGDYPYYDLKNELCPWTKVNIERAKVCPWLDANGNCDKYGIIQNNLALPIPPERIATRQDRESGFRDNKMIYADHVLKGDETVFWFLNDKGNTHTETKGSAIGLEIRVQAFAFATNNELNKMTFYSYEIINRSSITLYDTYFSQWCDPDLGYSHDDFVGCDVLRGLGYCYNGKEVDGSGQINAYGENPPAVGLDFFQGPYIDPDGVDNPKFYRGRANINGNTAEKEYCQRFVHTIFDNFDINDPNLLDKFYVIPNTEDTIRWNDQFAINGVNFGDGIVDNERFGMRAFTYHNNGSGPRTDPDIAIHYYNYLRGYWKDGTRFSYGGDAYSNESDKIECDFVFPAGSDYCNWGTKGKDPGDVYNHGGKSGNWSELKPDGNNTSQSNNPDDRRFMQSAGPFTLQQGACNYITVGVPWARALQGGVEASITLLLVADDKCQALFENCFKILDGPDAPTLTIREYDQKLILLLTNSPLSNNANEDYIEPDNNIELYRIDFIQTYDTIGKDSILLGDLVPDTVWYDVFYRFEGYQIFQVRGPEVSADDLENPDLARIVRQYDIENFDDKGNPIGRIINWEYDERLGVTVPKEKVLGNNMGIEHSFEVTQDLFATGARQLVNYKTYYFIAVAYAYNQYLPFNLDPDDKLGLLGQKLPYLRGRKTAEGRSVVPIAAVPHPPTVHGGGSTLNSDYGSIPYITRIDGQGNGGIALDLMPEIIDKIVSGGDNNDYRVRELKYDKNAGPLGVKVIDPLRVKPFDYTLIIKDTIMDKDTILDLKNRADVSNASYWVLYIDQSVTDEELINLGLVDNKGKPTREFRSLMTIGIYNEQIIMPLGISIAIHNKDFISTDPNINKFKDKILKKYDPYRMKYMFCQTQKIAIADNNDIIFENNGDPWITGLIDDNKDLPSNWIRAGNRDRGPWVVDASTNQIRGHYNMERLEDFFIPSNLISEPKPGSKDPESRAFKDYTGQFGTLCGGTWAPYVLTSPYDNGPQAKFTVPEPLPFPTNDYEGTTYGTGTPAGTGLYSYYSFKRIDKYESQPGYNQTMTNLYSVNVVITPDKSKWSRCVVLEACEDRTLSEGGALKNEPRHALSVGKDGKPDGSTDGFYQDGKYGLGWFPGYAINLETGERLNMMFAENSDASLNEFGDAVNGRDMIFNPTSTYAIFTQDLPDFGISAGLQMPKGTYDELYDRNGADGLYALGIARVWGGMHYVYVCNSAGNTAPTPFIDRGVLTIPSDFMLPSRRNFNLNDTVFTLNNGTNSPTGKVEITWGGNNGYLDADKKYPFYDCGPYDEGKWLIQKFKQVLSYEKEVENNPSAANILLMKHTKMQLFNNVMYTHIPMQPENSKLKAKWMSCDVTYKIRVTRPYLRYISRWYEAPELRDYSIPAEYEKYKGYPVYQLSTKGLNPTFNDTRLYQSILDNINIVPNPYYAKSLYELDAIQNMVKITNLPTDLKNGTPVTINIYTVSGILVRTLTKGDSQTSYVNWDLKNYANIPIASGVYIIHVNCPGIGERMLKFFCIMRQVDLNTF
ncbi:MAG: hypothetical protein FWF70_08355 [Bacteroidetes bacterium]|nr:hypothetical protein [Bacteroidota bacterium]MCL1968264.1 hypothetical protein [Bacteroidota bacterium]